MVVILQIKKESELEGNEFALKAASLAEEERAGSQRGDICYVHRGRAS
jgi:hypothetical protein